MARLVAVPGVSRLVLRQIRLRGQFADGVLDEVSDRLRCLRLGRLGISVVFPVVLQVLDEVLGDPLKPGGLGRECAVLRVGKLSHDVMLSRAASLR